MISVCNYKHILSHKEILIRRVSKLLIYILKSYIFCLNFNLYLHVWIRIQKLLNTDPDPQHWVQLVLSFRLSDLTYTTESSQNEMLVEF